MVYKKSVLRKLETKLDKLKIKADAIASAAEVKGKSNELVRLVLKGDRSDNDNIIEYLQEYYQSIEDRINEVSNKINQ